MDTRSRLNEWTQRVLSRRCLDPDLGLELIKDRVRRALPRLLASTEIESDGDGGYRIVDPLLTEWIERMSGGWLVEEPDLLV